MDLDTLRLAYSARAADYVEECGGIERATQADRSLLLDWAGSLVGRVIDVGCGPGQWTHLLRDAGMDIAGVDPVSAFVDHARRTYPDERFRVGRAEDLGVGDASLGGVLAWYSLIHTHPEQIDAPFAEFARVVAPGGGLALGFFTGPRLEAFDHAVTTAYFWPVEQLTVKVEEAGFQVTHTETRTDSGARPHGAILAVREGEIRPTGST